MRHFKLNSVLFSLLVMVGVTFLMTSCGKEATTPIAPAATEEERVEMLSNDDDFIKVLELNQQLREEMGNVLTAKSVSVEDFRDMALNGDTEALEDLFSGTEINNIMNEIIPINEKLATKYSDLYQEGHEFDRNVMEAFNPLDDSMVENRGCDYLYFLCQGIAAGSFAICTGASSGVAFPVCVAMYTAATAYCSLQHCSF